MRSATTCAYTVHAGAATAGMWNAQTIRCVDEIFDRAVARRLVPDRSVRRWEAAFVHQFILAGAYRSLRVRKRGEANQVLRLFDLPEVRRLGVSAKWLPVRLAFETIASGHVSSAPMTRAAPVWGAHLGSASASLLPARSRLRPSGAAPEGPLPHDRQPPAVGPGGLAVGVR